ncbi:hypothetical protein WISP_138048 [Willisornis vidua]|uniref:Uncharacterized protein n=1 Tax=Willisornis vidua TaxID=1566151 RepID=A0ABQ9CTF5_9PASS|nr:hypothetical protein WISP_138048 [Willisornis vidua]
MTDGVPYQCLYVSREWVVRGWSQALLSDAQQQDKRQQAETDAQKVSPEYKEELYCVDDRTLEQLPRVVVEPPSLEIFKNSLDTILCHVLWDDPA